MSILLLAPVGGPEAEAVTAWTATPRGSGATVETVTTKAAALAALASRERRWDVLVCKLGTSDADFGLPVVEAVRAQGRPTFVCVSSRTAVDSAQSRWRCFESGANMVTCVAMDVAPLMAALDTVATTLQPTADSPVFTCPYCKMPGLSEEGLFLHMPLYHIHDVRGPGGAKGGGGRGAGIGLS